jgi:hypothetical protein
VRALSVHPALLPALGLAAVLALAPAPAGAAAPPCADPSLTRSLLQQRREGHHLNAHALAQALVLLCPNAPAAAGWRLVDGLSLVELEERSWAEGLLAGVRDDGRAPLAERRSAAVLLAWSGFRASDERAALAAASALPPADRLRIEALARAEDEQAFAPLAAGLPPALRPQAEAEAARFRAARATRRPWLAGAASAVLPGLGQVYAGSWQAAAVALALNAAAIGATVELARHDLYFTAVAAGVGASFFYVGSILNAVDLARRRNERAALPHRHALERLLVPEALLF